MEAASQKEEFDISTHSHEAVFHAFEKAYLSAPAGTETLELKREFVRRINEFLAAIHIKKLAAAFSSERGRLVVALSFHKDDLASKAGGFLGVRFSNHEHGLREHEKRTGSKAPNGHVIRWTATIDEILKVMAFQPTPVDPSEYSTHSVLSPVEIGMELPKDELQQTQEYVVGQITKRL